MAGSRIANPGPLGLAGFALTTALLQGGVTAITEPETSFLVYGFAFAFGGAAQALAGIFAFNRGNLLPAVAFVCYGAWWLGWAITGSLTAAGVYPPPAHDGEKMMLSLWGERQARAEHIDSWALGAFDRESDSGLALRAGILTFFFFCASLTVNLMLQSLFLLLSIVFFLLAGGVSNPHAHKAGGWIGLVVSGIAFYGAAAELLNELYKKTVLPLGVCNPGAAILPWFQSAVGAVPLLGPIYLRAVEHEDRLAGYAPLPAPAAPIAHASDASPSIPSASIDLSPAYRNKQQAAAAGGVEALAEECRLERVVSNLQASCSQQPTAPPVSSKFAAVLVPLFEDPASGEVHVVLNQRSSKLKTHSGEVCFPGGKREPGDADDISTALREAQEELGLDPSCVQVIACLPPFLSKHLLSVTPVIGLIPPHQAFRPNPQEVESVFTAPLHRFLQAGPGYSHRDVEWQPGMPYRLHYFEHESQGRSYTIWGLTAGMLIVIAEKAFGRPPEFLPNPPNSLPYTALAFENGKLVLRTEAVGAPSGDALGMAADAAAAESPRSAAQAGAVVTDSEAAAALGAEEEGSSGDEAGGHGPAAAGGAAGRVVN
ncbi:nudix hydrolase mitochondrial-like [Chlorella sorokiniana]|uniref:Nudix hydrolase mitochondrial-like n=1 Tax=Chlorella sorokiniana TaxID=3076 RepID=A0A2P6TYA9_CHLSO|nr:nudix hydrolase mitochondrial-like [Chlorella sorokiniana]|eukprot:PRW59038.1 nudix hydrolase mitochondrial-like [Chlorella sorokiniana]